MDRIFGPWEGTALNPSTSGFTPARAIVEAQISR
jgi:hypothetical protein